MGPRGRQSGTADAPERVVSGGRAALLPPPGGGPILRTRAALTASLTLTVLELSKHAHANPCRRSVWEKKTGEKISRERD